MWLLADPQPEDELTEVHAQRALEAAHELLDGGMFRGRWSKASRAEREFQVAMAQTADREKIFSSRDYSAALERTTQQLSPIRQTLIDTGLIEASGFGRLRFTTPGFGDFVLLQVGHGPQQQ